MAELDVTGQLPDVAAPALVVHRRGMTQIPIDIPRSLAMSLPRGRLVVLEGTQPTLFGEGADAVVSMLARRLGLSTHTVERHVANLYRKIGARGRADATAYALRSGLA